MLTGGGLVSPYAGILLLDTITKLNEMHRQTVVVSGSHGGVYAGYCAAQGGVRAVIFNDANVGKDRAGIASLELLDRIGLAAATADSASCRIADSADMWVSGIISHVNAAAASAGCIPGEAVAQCAEAMRHAPVASASLPRLREARSVLRSVGADAAVIGIDSMSLLKEEDAGRIVISGSHGGLIGGHPGALAGVDVFAVVLNDAGGCKDDSGFTRLSWLQDHGIAAATVDFESARIGDARSTYRQGILSRVNARIADHGGRIGMATEELVEILLKARRRHMAG